MPAPETVPDPAPVTAQGIRPSGRGALTGRAAGAPVGLV